VYYILTAGGVLSDGPASLLAENTTGYRLNSLASAILKAT